jgi:hypothetical protein
VEAGPEGERGEEGDRCPTRRELLGVGVGVGAAAVGVGAAAVAVGAVGATWLGPVNALAATTEGAPATEAERLARLVSVEMLLAYTYRYVIASSPLRPATRRALVPLHANEEAHIAALKAALKKQGGVVPPGPTSADQANKALAHRRVGGRLGQLKGAKDALYLLLAIERVVVGAYFVALAKFNTPALMTLAAEIMANDAQHEALIGELLNPKRPGAAVPYGLVQGVQ